MSAVNADVAVEPETRKLTALRATPTRLTSLAAFLALAAFYALEHPYPGILGDSKIYMGRALADIDASGVGRDLMFRLDGQSQFSLFTPAARWLVAHLQLATGAMVIAAFGGVLWFAGAFAFARQALAGRAAIIRRSADPGGSSRACRRSSSSRPPSTASSRPPPASSRESTLRSCG